MSKLKNEKYNELIKINKKFIFEKNYGYKIGQFQEANKSTSKKYNNNKISLKHKNESLAAYIEHLKQKYKEHPNYFDNMNSSNNKEYFRYSFCFSCHNLAVAYQDKVICTNGCYELRINTDEFNSNYTLDMFLEEYYKFTSNHLFCDKENIIPIYIDNEKKNTFFICTKCDKQFFDKAGIIL